MKRNTIITGLIAIVLLSTISLIYAMQDDVIIFTNKDEMQDSVELSATKNIYPNQNIMTDKSKLVTTNYDTLVKYLQYDTWATLTNQEKLQ